jgi:hypothetical protein
MTTPTPKMKTILTTVVAGMALSSLGAAGSAAPSGVGNVQDAQTGTPWTLPSVFSGKWMRPGVSLSLNAYYTNWEGRQLQMKEGILGFAPDRNWKFWYGKQDYLAKGRSGKSRFDMTADDFGVRALIKQPEPDGFGGLALQVEYFRPSDATSRIGASTAIYFGTRDLNVNLAYSDPSADYEVGYTNVRGSGSGKADVFDVGFGKDFERGSMAYRLQANLFAESTQLVGAGTKSDLRLGLFGTASYRVNDFFNLEGDLYVMPFGIPVAGGRLTPLTSFVVYNPGGAVNDLRQSFIAMGTLRLVFHSKF